MRERVFPTNYTKKLMEQDVNDVIKFDKFNCTMPNDFIDWNTLSSEVTVYKLTPEEIEKYLNGELKL